MVIGCVLGIFWLWSNFISKFNEFLFSISYKPEQQTNKKTWRKCPYTVVSHIKQLIQITDESCHLKKCLEIATPTSRLKSSSLLLTKASTVE